jgi:poly(A)-specific ribonuclease
MSELSPEEKAENLYESEMGFSLVVEELIKAKKPIVGHNMIYDIIYLYNQFIDELPDTYNNFIEKWYSMFPSVYDTKVLSH